MCWKKRKPEVILPASKRALLFAINAYGGGNDLNGCINDQKDLEAKLNAQFPGFDIRKFKDSEVTTDRFMSELEGSIAVLKEGDVLLVHYSGHGTTVLDRDGDEQDGEDEALYLKNGVLTDDRIGKALEKIPSGAKVILMFDSCFSGTITRAVKKAKFIPNPELAGKRLKRKRHLAVRSGMNHVVFSGCSEDQTSADAYISGRYNGAFTFYALLTLQPGMTYNTWFGNIRIHLPNKSFDQIPTLEGPEDLLTQTVFT